MAKKNVSNQVGATTASEAYPPRLEAMDINVTSCNRRRFYWTNVYSRNLSISSAYLV